MSKKQTLLAECFFNDITKINKEKGSFMLSSQKFLSRHSHLVWKRLLSIRHRCLLKPSRFYFSLAIRYAAHVVKKINIDNSQFQ